MCKRKKKTMVPLGSTWLTQFHNHFTKRGRFFVRGFSPAMANVGCKAGWSAVRMCFAMCWFVLFDIALFTRQCCCSCCSCSTCSRRVVVVCVFVVLVFCSCICCCCLLLLLLLLRNLWTFASCKEVHVLLVFLLTQTQNMCRSMVSFCFVHVAIAKQLL